MKIFWPKYRLDIFYYTPIQTKIKNHMFNSQESYDLIVKIDKPNRNIISYNYIQL